MNIDHSRLTKVNDRLPGRRPAFDRANERKWNVDIVEEDFWEITEAVWDYTVCGVCALYHLYSALRYIFDSRLAGDVVECGVHLGGSIMFAAEMCRRYDADPDRRIFALDTFSGFVNRTPGVDVDYAGKDICHPNRTPTDFFDIAQRNMRAIDFAPDRLKIVRGDVAKTIPVLDSDRIALLRLDTDTYETTKLELEGLHGRVVRGGVVIIDDYGFNVGCATAVNDFVRGRLIFPMRQDRNGRSWVRLDGSTGKAG
jgi:O-methyltransferase